MWIIFGGFLRTRADVNPGYVELNRHLLLGYRLMVLVYMQLGVVIRPSHFLLKLHAWSERVCWKGWVKVWVDLRRSDLLSRGDVAAYKSQLNRYP